MFGKLLKHEFRATGRTALPLLGGMLVLAVMARFAIRAEGPLEMLSGIVMFLYAMSFFAVGIGVVVTVIRRFRSSVLGDEGYLTMTLPASLHTILAAKTLTAVAWYILSGLAVVLSVVFSVMGAEEWRELSELLKRLLGKGDLVWSYAGDAVLLALEVLAAAIMSTLLFYAAMAVGYSFNRHKGLLSLVAFFVLDAVLNLIGRIITRYVFKPAGWMLPFELQSLLGTAIVSTIISAAVLYAVTWWCLRNRLNLE